MELFGKTGGQEQEEALSPELGTMLLSRPEGRTRIGEEEVAKAIEILNRYKRGKENLERRIVEDELWWELRHWEIIRR